LALEWQSKHSSESLIVSDFLAGSCTIHSQPRVDLLHDDRALRVVVENALLAFHHLEPHAREDRGRDQHVVALLGRLGGDVEKASTPSARYRRMSAKSRTATGTPPGSMALRFTLRARGT